ncbi:MAG: ABC transporter substrate-binding protein [Caldicoprobacterales bacterium]
MLKKESILKGMSIMLILMLFVSLALAGCAKDGETGNDTPDEEPNVETPAEDDKDTDDDKDNEGGFVKPEGDPVELIWLMGDPGQVPADQAMVEEKLDEISVEALNVKVTTLYVNNETVLLKLSTGEPWDMTFTCEWYNNYGDQARKGYFADITEKLQTLTPELYATMNETVWEGAKVDGKIYAIPVKKDYATELFFRFDKALFVDELGMEIPDNMDFHDIEEYLKAAKDAYESGNAAAADAEYPWMMTKGGVGMDRIFDMLNNPTGLGIPYSKVGTPDENKVAWKYEDEDYLDRLRAVHRWFKAGYINPDAAVLDEVGPYSAVKYGQGFYGADAIWTAADGFVQLISRFDGPYLSTQTIRGSMNAINANSEHIDLALKYQELVNTNQEYRDILRYGIEGVHFNYNDQGLVERTQEGVQKYGPWPFSQGSYSLSSVEAAEGVDVDPNMWQVIFDGYKDAVATQLIGFSFDITPVETQVAACQTIVDKYNPRLNTGTADPDVEVPKLREEMEAAGVREVQEEIQRQVDEFLANK